MVVENLKNSRVAEAPIDPMFTERWSSKSFTDAPLTDEQITSLFEAARWAPSASNRQPWVFVYATDGPDRDRFNALLNEKNSQWAPRASMMVLVFARVETDDGDTIRTGQFDTGAAWMSLALQANRMGLNTRAIGGINLDGAYEAAGVPRGTFQTMCGIAVGVPGSDDDLVPDLRDQNRANDRKPADRVAYRGKFSG